MKSYLVPVFILLSILSLLSVASAEDYNKALLIGISQYSDPDINCLAYADEDVRTFLSMLTNYAGYSSANIISLLNQEATKQNITNAILGLVRQSQKEPLDHFILMFAGHGLPPSIESNATNSFLAPSDSRINEFYKETSGSGSIVNNETFINKAWLTKQLSNLKAKQIIIILDSCYSGAKNFGELFSENLGFKVNLIGEESEREQRGVAVVHANGITVQKQSRIAFIASSNENQPSAEYPELKHGALSYCIFEYINAVRNETEAAETREITVGGMYRNVTRLFDEVEVRGASLSALHQPVLFPIPDYDTVKGMKLISIKGNKKKLLRTGRIEVITDPEGAEIFVDGTKMGKHSNCSLELNEGRHMISLFLPQTNYMHNVMVDVKAEEHKKEKVSLRGILAIEVFSEKRKVKLPKIKIYIDGKELKKPEKELQNLIAGTHSVTVIAEDTEKTRQIEIRPTSPLLVRYKITRTAAKPVNDNSADTVSF